MRVRKHPTTNIQHRTSNGAGGCNRRSVSRAAQVGKWESGKVRVHSRLTFPLSHPLTFNLSPLLAVGGLSSKDH